MWSLVSIFFFMCIDIACMHMCSWAHVHTSLCMCIYMHTCTNIPFRTEVDIGNIFQNMYLFLFYILSEYTSVFQVHVVFLEAKWRWILWNFIWSYRQLWAEPPHGCQELNSSFYERVTSALNQLSSPSNLVQLLSHVIFWGKVSQWNSELTVTESSDSHFAQGMISLSLLRLGTWMLALLLVCKGFNC